PAVASIAVTSRVPISELAQGGQDPFAPKPDGAANPDEPTAKAQALCSAFFISASGYLVTNDHCVRHATSLKVTLKDGRELTGKVIGTDEPTDLAVIKVEGTGFPFISFAGAARPRVGDWAIAIGNPYGLSGTATAGIVSASGREIGANFNDFIQIDTPINKGNSGGPTFDISGRVIGVNTIIFSETGDSVGIGFAIPADTVQSVTRQLIAQGKVSRGYLGATIQDLTPDIADSLGLPGRKGGLLTEIVPAGPAARAGLKSGDVVLMVDAHALTSSTDLTRRVAMTITGQSFDLGFYRDGQIRHVSVVSGRRPSEQQLARADGAPADQPPESAGSASALGMTFGAIDDATRRRYGLGDKDGVVVERVDDGSEAAEKGLQRGVVVFRAGERLVHAPTDIQGAVAQARKQGRGRILLGVQAGGRSAFLALKLKGEKGGEG
ncbi:MAG: trypsin-like peptidase domain-containing protein, partial [Caulobacteraceae bacterium]